MKLKSYLIYTLCGLLLSSCLTVNHKPFLASGGNGTGTPIEGAYNQLVLGVIVVRPDSPNFRGYYKNTPYSHLLLQIGVETQDTTPPTREQPQTQVVKGNAMAFAQTDTSTAGTDTGNETGPARYYLVRGPKSPLTPATEVSLERKRVITTVSPTDKNPVGYAVVKYLHPELTEDDPAFDWDRTKEYTARLVSDPNYTGPRAGEALQSPTWAICEATLVQGFSGPGGAQANITRAVAELVAGDERDTSTFFLAFAYERAQFPRIFNYLSNGTEVSYVIGGTPGISFNPFNGGVALQSAAFLHVQSDPSADARYHSDFYLNGNCNILVTIGSQSEQAYLTGRWTGPGLPNEALLGGN